MTAFDVIVTNGRVVDGAGNPWYKADVGISKGRIEQVGRLRNIDAKTIVDAERLIVCPGFIDIHTHSDLQLLVNPAAESHVYQGITTDVVGNCGISVAPVSEFYKERSQTLLKLYNMSWTWENLGQFLSILEKQGVSINVASLLGHTAVRAAVMGTRATRPSPKELQRMKEIVAKEMEQGAFGMSTGLYYAPGGFATTDEVVELAKVVAEYGGIYTTHMRSEGDDLIESVRETLEIGERANVPVQISHFKATGPENWGKIKQGFRMMEEARKKGVDVTCDAYPWIAGVTPLIDYLPRWVQQGGSDEILRKLNDHHTRRKISDDMQKGIPGEESLVKELGWERITISTCPSNPEYEGKTIKEILNISRRDPYDLIFELLAKNKSEVVCIETWGSEEDVEEVLKHPLTMISSDSAAIVPKGPLGSGKPHPRYYGNIPKLFNDYVNTRRIMTVEEAVRKSSSFPAQRLGLADRGQLKKGMWADMVIFDPDTFSPVGVFGDPHHYPKGLKYVFVNGAITIKDGKHTGAVAGKILRRPGGLSRKNDRAEKKVKTSKQMLH
jgi:N-acyl-D-amino-acid deacylase